ncbi:hypothetical protein I7I53_02278 [Histoplasma capsulatum var. duboisii H88]|uniref:Uncharacterized protein n=1 Tax=Ajellomyces capsulatus (strain H88) TaxID=544711 RepID=A0A8A1LJZ3_AJEC8|nr:hypothetical protein I7I53_02278 [Histoplasma capsulatum var. duboisii H88]
MKKKRGGGKQKNQTTGGQVGRHAKKHRTKATRRGAGKQKGKTHKSEKAAAHQSPIQTSLVIHAQKQKTEKKATQKQTKNKQITKSHPSQFCNVSLPQFIYVYMYVLLYPGPLVKKWGK